MRAPVYLTCTALSLLALLSFPAHAECMGTMSGRVTSCDNGTPAAGNTTNSAINALTNMGNFLQDRADQQAAQEQAARDAADARAAGQAAQFNGYADSVSNSDWEAQAQAAQGQQSPKRGAVNCNCTRTVGQCQATISQLKKTGKTGYQFRLASTEAQCSRVTYYLDNTPYLSVLNGKSVSIEQVSSLKPVRLEQLGVDRCEVCAQQ
ncbi:hypothetical protein [Pseudomonas sp. NPDC007930]|uniref:hypothetical protein n=1 Tax=Pseudomonas sp. NPDC007930 TaxID=3364417 RepID=UPI0036EE146D